MIGERRGNRVHNILSMVKGMFALLLLAVGCSCGNNVMASIGSVGPDSSANWRYNLTSYGTHKYISLSIPIYFQSDPGTVTIESFDLYVRNAKASFNGGAAVGKKTYRFKVSGFKYDKVSGLYKKTVTVQLRNASGGYGNWTNWEVYQFRLRLIKPTNGWISYGGGRVSQADRDYYKYAENYDVTSLGENQEMYMALPCTYNGSKKVKVNLWDLDDPAGGGLRQTAAIISELRFMMLPKTES